MEHDLLLKEVWHQLAHGPNRPRIAMPVCKLFTLPLLAQQIPSKAEPKFSFAHTWAGSATNTQMATRCGVVLIVEPSPLAPRQTQHPALLTILLESPVVNATSLRCGINSMSSSASSPKTRLYATCRVAHLSPPSWNVLNYSLSLLNCPLERLFLSSRS